MEKYDYIIVGAGFFGAICAYELNKIGKKVLVLEKRQHIGGGLGEYKYYNMDQVISSALNFVKALSF